MGLSDILHTARDALAAQTYGLGVTGHNVANVNTPGYVRREAILETRALGLQTLGSVGVSGLRRAVDLFTERRYFGATGMAAAAGERNAHLGVMEGVFNDFDGTGVGASIDALFQSFGRLATSPNDPTVRRTVLENAADFARNVSSKAGSIAGLRTELLTRAEGVTAQINRAAEHIAQLNRQIADAESRGSDAADLKDSRTQALLGLSELVDVHTLTDDDGGLVIQASGTTLVEGGNARSLSIGVAPDGTMQVFAARSGGAPTEVTRFLTGGELAGIRDARDVDAVAVLGRLDQLAFDVASAVNAQHASGFGLDGVTGRNLFSVSATVSGAARSLTVDPALVDNPNALAAAGAAADLPGGSDNALALSGLSTQKIATGGTRTASEAYSDLAGDLGMRKQNAAMESETKTAIRSQILAMREETSGVSLDEEMVQLTKFQRAYEAAARVLTTADELMAELIARVGR
jgi:flagellar hook-associated protein 1 FlgK